jgi:hypothetical protein
LVRTVDVVVPHEAMTAAAGRRRDARNRIVVALCILVLTRLYVVEREGSWIMVEGRRR